MVVEQIIIFGAVQGAVYALYALGYSLVYGVGGILNLAHGAYYLAAMYGFYFTWLILGGTSGLIIGMGIGLIVAVVIAMLSYFLIIKPLEHSEISVLIGTFAIGFFMETLVIVIYDPNFHVIGKLFTGYINIQVIIILTFIIVGFLEGNLILAIYEIIIKKFKYIKVHILSLLGIALISLLYIPISIEKPTVISLPFQYILIIIVSLIVVTLVTIFISKSKLGKSIRAVSQDREAAMLMGINVDRILLFTIMLSALLVGIAAILYCPVDIIAPHLGWSVLTAAIAVVILGGLGSLPGSVVGAFIIGYARIITDYLIDPVYSSLIPVIVIIIILVVRPRGLFGKKEIY
ncbi:MAG: branched-chain amino acid ABC transporter permease [Promethearchaeota archaeon]